MTPTMEQAVMAGKMGALAASQHADKVNGEWSVLAGCLFVDYAKHIACGEPFLTEDVRAWCEDVLPVPPDRRAWGHIARSLCNEGLIEEAGFRRAKSSNGSPKVLWRAVK